MGGNAVLTRAVLRKVGPYSTTWAGKDRALLPTKIPICICDCCPQEQAECICPI